VYLTKGEFLQKFGILPQEFEEADISWEELLEKGALLKEAIHRLSLMPGMPYLVTKSCTDGTFQKGDVIFLEPENDIFCPKTGRRISPGQCSQDNLDFECTSANQSD
jgi:hypothetical protein